MARLIEIPGGSGPVNEGERRSVAVLLERLPDEYKIIPNVRIGSEDGQQFEYDVIVVAPHAVYVIEVKDWWGEIKGDAVEWLVNGQSRKAPMPTTELKAKVLKSKLVNRLQALGRVWVQPVVALSSNPSTLDLSADGAKGVFLLDRLVPYLLDPSHVRQRASAIVDLTSHIIRAIRPELRPRTGPLIFGDYEVTERLEQTDEEAWYRARHRFMPGAPPVRLRVVTLPRYTLSEQQDKERLAQLMRETEALLRMGAHPNVIAARNVFTDEDGRIVLVLDGVEGRTLRQRLKDGTPLTVEQRAQILVDVCRALENAHSHDVVHRRVEPASILLSEDGVTRLGRFSLAKLLTDDAATVWHSEAAEQLDVRYMAPELLSPVYGQAGPESDLYGLGCVAYELFAGHPPFKSPNDAFQPLPALPAGLPAGLEALLPSLLMGESAQRAGDTAQVLGALERVASAEEAPLPTPPKRYYNPGDLIDGKFEVRGELGGGGFSTVYRVYWSVADRECALKVFNSDVPFDKVQRELCTLMDIANDHVVKVFYGDKTSSGQWYIASELVHGETLEAYADGRKHLSIEQIVDLGDQLLAALETIHPQAARIQELKNRTDGLTEEEYYELQELEAIGIVHRDIKPSNLMLTSNGIKLIDFNIASHAGATIRTISGTPRYLAPDLIAGVANWNVSPDLYATGVLLYELLCGHHPCEEDGRRDGNEPKDPRTHRPELSQEAADFLMKACAPFAVDRFTTAGEMRTALAAIESWTVPFYIVEADGSLPPRLQDLLDNAPPNVNPMVHEFLALSSQARKSNRGTRGLDDIARATYVETRLDADLSSSVLQGKHALVVITGNAGDGKTAFIQQVEAAAIAGGARELSKSNNGARLRAGNREVITLYDGSQDEEDRTSDEVLHEFFSPFALHGRSDGSVRLAAINEGRLRDFLTGHRTEYPRLATDMIAVLDDPTTTLPSDEIMVVNLNLRSVTSGGSDSIFSRQVRRIVEGPFWGPCERCDYRAQCPLKHNVDTLRDRTSGAAAIERLRVLVDLIRLRRRRHLTMRDVRSLISHILFRDRACEEVPQLLQSRDAFSVIDIAYFQAPGGLGAPEGSALERNAALLAETDVADVANPELDWALAHGNGPRRMEFPTRSSEYPRELAEETRRRAGQGYEADHALARRTHAALRWLTYFERADDDWRLMLPYQRLGEFEEALTSTDTAARSKLCRDVIQAVSIHEGLLDAGLAADALWLATDEGAPAEFRCFRRFPVEEFSLRVVTAPAQYIESEPDHLELVHEGGAHLDLDIDLMEMLERLKEGFLPPGDEGRGFIVNLELFKNRLLAEPARELLLIGEGQRMRITVGEEPGSVALSEVAV